MSQSHCSNCGEPDPEFISYGSDDCDGFTACCNEKVCRSEEFFLFGDDEKFVKACCWAMAEKKFKEKKIDYQKMFEIRRSPLKE